MTHETDLKFDQTVPLLRTHEANNV